MESSFGKHALELAIPSPGGGIVGLGCEPSPCNVAQLLLDATLQLLIVELPVACRCLTHSFHVAKLLPLAQSALGDF